jgi:hypothetical protein
MSEPVIEKLRVAFERQFEAIHAKLDRLDEAIRGNGKLGLLVRVDRLERDGRRQDKLIWLVTGALVTSVVGAIVAWIGGVL